MTDIFDYLGRTNTLWKEHKFGNFHTIDVSEIPRPGSGGSRETPSHRTLSTNELEHWLSTHTSVLQMVWVEHNTASQRSNILSSAADSIFSAFGLEVAYKYSRTCFAGAAQVASRDSPGDRSDSFSFSYHPKMILLWTYDVAKKSTRGICFAGRDQILVFKNSLDEHWLPLSQPMTIGLLAILVLSGEVDRTQKDIKTEVSKVEVRTGCHRWHNRSEDRAPGDLAELFAIMSGSATKTASISKKIEIIQELGNFCLVHTAEKFPHSTNVNSERNDDGNHTQDKDEMDELQKDISLVRQRAKMQQASADLITRRIDIQLNALQNLITQYDSLVNLGIARDSKVVAAASQRDSYAMKSLAVVTMVFLPGTFVATLFSMPLFDWHGSENISASGLGIYWATAIPLTVVTISIWIVWTYFQSVKIRRQNRRAERRFYEGTEMSEITMLAWRRKTEYTV